MPLPFASYERPSDILPDIFAGLTVAALSIPVSMGYAQVAGLPAVFGLYGAIVITFVYALFSKTQHVIFGMDSAAVAITGSMLSWMGIAAFSQTAIDIMPALTLTTAVFLIIFHLVKFGSAADFVPDSVMQGFILGVVCMVSVNQFPALLGAQVGTSGFLPILQQLSTGLQANTLTILLSAITLTVMFTIPRWKPTWPTSIAILLVMTAASIFFDFQSAGVAVLGTIPQGIPLPVIPTLSDVHWIQIVISALAIAITVTIESILTLKVFGEANYVNSEIRAFGIANAAGAIFCCPAGSASLSRTAAAVASHGKSQMASIISAVTVLAFLLLFSPFLEKLPLCVLSAIVLAAMVSLVNVKTIARYARKVKSEFANVLIVAGATTVFGALVGFGVGVAISLILHFWRKASITGDEKEMGFGGADEEEDASPETESHLQLTTVEHSLVASMAGFPSFTNVNPWIRQIRNELETAGPAIDEVIFNLSAVYDMDITAADALRVFMDALKAKDYKIKVVRELGPTGDSYARYAIRRVMKRGKLYPSVEEALTGKHRKKLDDVEVVVPGEKA